MATKYNAQMEDSEGNVYLIKPDLIETKEALNANTTAGKAVDALVVKELNKNMGGVKFGITADGQPGYKKDGADTVYPFSHVSNIKHAKHTSTTGLRKKESTVSIELTAGDYILIVSSHYTGSDVSNSLLSNITNITLSCPAETIELGYYKISLKQTTTVTATITIEQVNSNSYRQMNDIVALY